MGLYLEIVNGEGQGNRYPIASGVRIGRLVGEIILKDRKVSALHAQFEMRADGSIRLKDQGSTNAIVQNGKKIRSLDITPGVNFQIGRVGLRVIEIIEEVKKPEPEPMTWRQILAKEVPRLSAQKGFQPSLVEAFASPIHLHFIEGVQAEEIYKLGFGPRRFGSDVLDIELWDPEAPALAFEIQPVVGGARFSTDHPEIVLLNEDSIANQVLQEGDTIRIGRTLIKVSFR